MQGDKRIDTLNIRDYIIEVIVYYEVNRMYSRVENLLKEINNFTPDEEIELIERLAQRLKTRNIYRKDILDLFGCAKNLWENIDAQEYINSLRKERQ